jgi:uncharacterized protein (UPF0548 family)
VTGEFTYPQVGATRPGGTLPAGYRHVRRHAEVGRGDAAFACAAETLATWGMHRGAGLVVRASAARAAEGVLINTGLGIGPLRLWSPCRVVWVLDEPARYGWAYGTVTCRPMPSGRHKPIMRDHPITGEEAFEVSIDDAGRVWTDIRAFSRPATAAAKLGALVLRTMQDRITDRYVRALAGAARPTA